MNKALFLDRDGVINKEINHLYRIEDFEFTDGIFEVCHFFIKLQFQIFVITNQSGIARGLYTEDDFHKLTDWMLNQFVEHDIHLREVFYCPFHAEAGAGQYKQESFNRKPQPGMILKAQDKYNIDLTHSVIIGDKESDIEAGINAGVGCTVLLTKDKNIIDRTKADFVVASLREVPQRLVFQRGE